MTPEQQSRADHLALVAAPIYATMKYDEFPANAMGTTMRALDALDYASALQKAAEERVKG